MFQPINYYSFSEYFSNSIDIEKVNDFYNKQYNPNIVKPDKVVAVKLDTRWQDQSSDSLL